MLTLYQFPAPWDVCSASCFCAKVEAFLRWQGLDHDIRNGLSLSGAPKGKVPFIEDEHGRIGDSEFIIAYLCRKHGLAPDATLSPAQQGTSRAIRYLCEEGLYRAMSYYRFVDDAGWAVIRTSFIHALPLWMRPLAGWKIRRYVKHQLEQQGIARHSAAEIAQMAEADLQALADMLGDQPYFFGDQMHLADIVVFSVIVNLVTPPFDNPVTQTARAMPSLVAHCQRVKRMCFGQDAAVHSSR